MGEPLVPLLGACFVKGSGTRRSLPGFGFGNASQDQCTSTACLEVLMNGRDNLLKVHALGKGCVPIIKSVSSKATGQAVVDFENDLLLSACARRLKVASPRARRSCRRPSGAADKRRV